MPLDELRQARARIFGGSRLRSVGWLKNGQVRRYPRNHGSRQEDRLTPLDRQLAENSPCSAN